MRLTEDQVNIIKESVIKVFGVKSKVYLFGSRIDDTKKGGDIDLYVQADFSSEEMFYRKIDLLTELQSKLGERKIDIITSNNLIPGEPVSLIVEEALMNGVEL